MNDFLKNVLKFSTGIFLPLFLLAILYLMWDPFKVVNNYDSYYKENEKARVGLNKDFISTKTFIKNNKEVNYNSFIFGNSRSIFFQMEDWKKHLDSTAHGFHFDASGEGLWALNKKIEFIDKQNNKIKNALIILDYTTIIRDGPLKGHLTLISPALVDYKNILDFHQTYFLAFLNPKFLYAYLDFKLTGKVKSYMKKDYILDDRPQDYDVLTNELRFTYFENLIKKDQYYTEERMASFYKRDTTIVNYYPKVIGENQKLIFRKIKCIMKKHDANVKIVVNPLYNQKKINIKDLEYLSKMFGEENVFDFSGINRFTNDYKNFYENSHYRPHVAREILEIVYKKNPLY